MSFQSVLYTFFRALARLTQALPRRVGLAIGVAFATAVFGLYRLTPVRGFVQGTTDIGQTSFLSLFAGFAFTNTLTLQAWNFKGELVGTAQNDCGAGQCRSYITLNAPGISYFRLSSTGQDTYGIPEIQLETPTAPRNSRKSRSNASWLAGCTSTWSGTPLSATAAPSSSQLPK